MAQIIHFILFSLGFLISLYAYVVKKKLLDFTYKPLCDISRKISCSRAFKESESALFGVPNAALGMIAYGLLLFAEVYNVFAVRTVLIPLLFLTSLYLIHILLKKKILCIICFTIHFINIILMLLLILRFVQ